MQVIETIADLRKASGSCHKQGRSIGFVPTMGNLHAGHLSLVKQAVETCDLVVVSIFVNPLQFDQTSDLDAYPRTLEQDLAKLELAQADLVFVPCETELYPHGRDSITRVEVPGLSEILEGASRPGHFAGVTTVVAKLFQCVQADRAFFGEKDFQQLMLVRRMVDDLNMPVEIIAMPTTREDDGLAMSSRNRRLSLEQRRSAPILYQVLQELRQQLREGQSDYLNLAQQAENKLEKQGFNPDYVTVRYAIDLSVPEAGADINELVILAAARLGETRLIDNIRV
ncbi:MAG: pantoate--beta-alanine ligase [Gammaproteobacteria bacterium]|nr:pantoate--beta-alanine ligase [Gammaproteobacteria bacterium]